MDSIFFAVGHVVCSAASSIGFYSFFNNYCVLNIGGFGGMNIPNYTEVGKYTIVVAVAAIAIGWFNQK